MKNMKMDKSTHTTHLIQVFQLQNLEIYLKLQMFIMYTFDNFNFNVSITLNHGLLWWLQSLHYLLQQQDIC